MRLGTVATWAIVGSLAGWAVMTSVAKTPPDTSNGLSVGLELPDGMTWTLTEGGIGRPFLVRFVLANQGKTALKIWHPDNSEGRDCFRVVLTNSQGKTIVLRPEPIERSAGVPSAWTIDPGQKIPVELDLLRLIGAKSPTAGEYQLHLEYHNELANSGPVKQVWTGHVASLAKTIRIAPPRTSSEGSK